MQFMSRYVLVGLLVSGMVVDTAMAGRLFRRACCRCRPAPVCAVPCRPLVCSEPVVVPAVETCWGAPGAYASGSPTHSVVVPAFETLPVVEAVVASTPMPTLAEEPIEFYSTAGPIDALRPAVVDPPAPLAVPQESSKTILVPAPSVVAKPVVVEPVAESAAEDRKTEAVDFFDEPTTPAPIVPPKPEAEPASEEKPEDDSEDLFSGLDQEEVEEVVEEAVENEEVVEEVVKEVVEEVIVPEALAPMPVEKVRVSDGPEAEMDFGDALFGPSDESGSLSEEPQKKGSKSALPMAPASVEPSLVEPTPDVPEEYDVFGAEARASFLEAGGLGIRGGLESESNRVWTDQTATFRCEARLVDVSTKSVTLLKSTGGKILIPLARLGMSDLQFVQQQVVALRVARSRDAAAEKLATAWAK